MSLSQVISGSNPASGAAHDTSSRSPLLAFSPWANKEFLQHKFQVFLVIMHQGAADEEGRQREGIMYPLQALDGRQ